MRLSLAADGRAHRQGQPDLLPLDRLFAAGAGRQAAARPAQHRGPHFLRNPLRAAAADAGLLQRGRARHRQEGRRTPAGAGQRHRAQECRGAAAIHPPDGVQRDRPAPLRAGSAQCARRAQEAERDAGKPRRAGGRGAAAHRQRAHLAARGSQAARGVHRGSRARPAQPARLDRRRDAADPEVGAGREGECDHRDDAAERRAG